ncbi:helix-turn-helix domain-containing protein [Candidatus Nitrospira inopinata]|uniref:helix-turn-helix domain-containing protein n=1 Tax=Candidatus Nitrospira inopinata TaxID=1715989 RepID=UPI0009E74691
MEPVLLRVQEAARLLNVSKWTIYRWIDEGRLRATKIGGSSLRVFRASVDDLIGKAKITDGDGIERNGPITERKSRSQGNRRNTRSSR